MTKLTMLNAMASPDFIQSLDTQAAWGIEVLDLKDRIWGKSLLELSEEEAERAALAIKERELSVHCMSTSLFHDDLERGENYFRDSHLSQIEQTSRIARILRPTVIRMLSPRIERNGTLTDSIGRMKSDFAWFFPMLRDAVDRLSDEGFEVTIENECEHNIFSHPQEIIDFFEILNRPDSVYFTYDVQNLWQMGTLPTLDIYRTLKPLIGYFHLKGGRAGEDGRLLWKSTLEDASWPVAEMTLEVVRDGVSPVICLNPSHGGKLEGYDYSRMFQRDLDYIRSVIQGK
ncbi:xylose isomerase [Paenibacillus silviterrae]|uniref:xylose isomerase n=1 Tax=Paenibacillus silviterrae TaxID=3242194 RepID=UPI00254386E5|nr:xylose isomerase [Paenibacillus chinjuensis]